MALTKSHSEMHLGTNYLVLVDSDQPTLSLVKKNQRIMRFLTPFAAFILVESQWHL